MCGWAASTASMAASRALKSGVSTSITVCGVSARTASIVRRKWSAPPSARSSRATAVMTTCRSRRRWVASATRAGSSASSGKGLAVVTAQNPQARVQRSPPIMKVAVPLLQHSQWFGHGALWQTVCSLSSSSRARVCAKLSVVGSRSVQPGRQTRARHGGSRVIRPFYVSSSLQKSASCSGPKSARILPSTSNTGARSWPESRIISS